MHKVVSEVEGDASFGSNGAGLNRVSVDAGQGAKEGLDGVDVLDEGGDRVRKKLRVAVATVSSGVKLVGGRLVCGVDVDVGDVVVSTGGVNFGAKAGQSKDVGGHVRVKVTRAAEGLNGGQSGRRKEVREDVVVAGFEPLKDVGGGGDFDADVDRPVSRVNRVCVDVACDSAEGEVAVGSVCRVVNGGTFGASPLVKEERVLKLAVLLETGEQLLDKGLQERWGEVDGGEVKLAGDVAVLGHGHAVADGPMGELVWCDSFDGGANAFVVKQSEVGRGDLGRASCRFVEVGKKQEGLVARFDASDANVGNAVEFDDV